jgi:hypothetical protein
MLLKCRSYKHQVHDYRFSPSGVYVTLLWWSMMALSPVMLARKNPLYLLLLPFAIWGVIFWLLGLLVVGLSMVFTYLQFARRRCPSCARRKWTWPVLDVKDTAM